MATPIRSTLTFFQQQITSFAQSPLVDKVKSVGRQAFIEVGSYFQINQEGFVSSSVTTIYLSLKAALLLKALPLVTLASCVNRVFNSRFSNIDTLPSRTIQELKDTASAIKSHFPIQAQPQLTQPVSKYFGSHIQQLASFGTFINDQFSSGQTRIRSGMLALTSNNYFRT